MLYRTPSRSQPRKGVVLVAVLIVVTVLALAAYQYSELMTAEYRAAGSYTKTVQTKSFALAGVNYVAGALSDYDFFTNQLNSNPYDNQSFFQDIVVQQGDTPQQTGYFSVIAILSPDNPSFQQQPWRFGVTDEASKINVNALLKYGGGGGGGASSSSTSSSSTSSSSTASTTGGSTLGAGGEAMLLMLPNMTQDLANSMLDWIDGSSSSPRSGGAKDDYYPGLQPPYHVKNGPIDSLDELLNVQGMTTDLLYGSDLNFNGQLDPGEVGGIDSGGPDLGLAPYLTLYSRESNMTNAGLGRIYLNDPSLQTLQTNLTPVLGSQLTNFILAYRLYGASSTGGGGSGASANSNQQLSGSDQNTLQSTITAAVSNPNTKPQGTITSLFSLITAKVQVQTGSGRTAKTITYASPLSYPGQSTTLLPLLLDNCTTSQKQTLTPRININTAGETVLTALAGLPPSGGAGGASTTGSSAASSTTASSATSTPTYGILQANDIQSILSNQPTYTNGAPDSTYSTPAWLVTTAGLSPSKVQQLEPYITARSTVYKFQVLGYFGGSGGPVSRLEAVVDTSFGRPRILYIRDLTERGRAFDMTQISQHVQNP
jgi:DNA uptake protein ComE-like DNA-binding protein